MSAEAPRNSGRGEPISPQRRVSGFPRFFRGLFGVPSELQPAQQPTTGIVQLPPELSDFAIRINNGIMDGLDKTKRAELQRIEHNRQSAERDVREREAIEWQTRQLVQGRLKVLEEIEQITEYLKIWDKLTYINATVWEGKGQLRSISTTTESAPLTNEVGWFGDWEPQVGFELVVSYPAAVEERENVPFSHGRFGYNRRLVPGMEIGTYLRVFTKSFDRSGVPISSLFPHVERGRVLDVSSPYIGMGKKEVGLKREGAYHLGDGDDPFIDYIGRAKGYVAFFKDYARFRLGPQNYEGVVEKLDQVLVNESAIRVKEGILPSRLILAGQERLKYAKASTGWMKWEFVEVDTDPHHTGGN